VGRHLTSSSLALPIILQYRSKDKVMDMADKKEFFRESNAIEDVYSEQALEESLEAWEYLKQQDELEHHIVKETHHMIMRNRQVDIAGEYRDVQVYVGDHTPPPPEVVRMKMQELLQVEPETAEEAVKWHISFETIHPFQDGNGRIGRMIYYWHCRQLGVEPELWTADERQKYYEIFDDRNGIIEGDTQSK
jgi:Fic family protein